MNDEDLDIGVKTPWGTVEPFRSNEIPMCLECNVPITEENNSGWQLVVDPEVDEGLMQSVCKQCWSKNHETI